MLGLWLFLSATMVEPARADADDAGLVPHWLSLAELMLMMLALKLSFVPRWLGLWLSPSATVVEHGLGDAHDAGLGGSYAGPVVVS